MPCVERVSRRPSSSSFRGLGGQSASDPLQAVQLLALPTSGSPAGHRGQTERVNLAVGGAAFGLVFLAEWGDLPQFVTAELSARTAAPLAVFAGAALALVCASGLAVGAGSVIERPVPARLARQAVGIVLIALATLAGTERGPRAARSWRARAEPSSRGRPLSYAASHGAPGGAAGRAQAADPGPAAVRSPRREGCGLGPAQAPRTAQAPPHELAGGCLLASAREVRGRAPGRVFEPRPVRRCRSMRCPSMRVGWVGSGAGLVGRLVVPGEEALVGGRVAGGLDGRPARRGREGSDA